MTMHASTDGARDTFDDTVTSKPAHYNNVPHVLDKQCTVGMVDMASLCNQRDTAMASHHEGHGCNNGYLAKTTCTAKVNKSLI